MPLTHHWTSKDLEAFPPAEGTRYEIIDGELYVSHQPSWHHQYTCSALIAALHTWSQATGLGAATGAPGILFAEDQDVAPDVVWISHTRLQGTLDPAGHLTCAPELVIEVLSPGRTNVRRDREVKLGVYRQQGGRLAHVDYLTGADTLLSPVLPGFACPVGTLFAQAEPGPRGDAPDG